MPGKTRDTQPTDSDTREDPALGDRRRPAPGIIDLSRQGGRRNGDPSPSGAPSRDDSLPEAAADADVDQSEEDTDVGTRERIVQAAADVFLQKGFTGTRVVDIARRAGYTSGALYGYFDSRAELLAEAVARGSSQMLSRLLGTEHDDDTTSGTNSNGDDPMSVLQSALAQIASPIDESGQMLLDGIALAHREPVAGDRLAQTIEEFRSELAHADKGGLSEDAADMLVVLVLGITAARALGWHDPPSPEMRDHIAECLMAASKATSAS